MTHRYSTRHHRRPGRGRVRGGIGRAEISERTGGYARLAAGMDRGRCQPSVETTPSLKGESRTPPHLASLPGSFKRVSRIFSIKGNVWIEWIGGNGSSVRRDGEEICTKQMGRDGTGGSEGDRGRDSPTKKPQSLWKLRLGARATSGTRTLDFSFTNEKPIGSATPRQVSPNLVGKRLTFISQRFRAIVVPSTPDSARLPSPPRA
jgi:hypothetical protein